MKGGGGEEEKSKRNKYKGGREDRMSERSIRVWRSAKIIIIRKATMGKNVCTKQGMNE